MKALVLEKQLELQLRDIDLPTEVGPDDVKINSRHTYFSIHFSYFSAIKN